MSGLTLDVYDPLNQTYQGTLTQAISSEFVDEFNGAGYGTCTVALDSADAHLLVKDAVIRVTYQGSVRFAWVVETRERNLADSGNSYTLTASGRGLLAVMLEDAVVYPQGGLADFNLPDRPFNYASADGGWKSLVTYTAPQGVQWKNDTTARAGLPVRWKDPAAQWIWKSSPSAAVVRGEINWFWEQFTLTSSKRITFWASCDNSMTVYLDGTLIMDSSKFDQDAPSFSQMARYTVRLGVGTHTLAARVRAGVPWRRFDVSVSESDDKVSASSHGLANGTRVKVIDKTGAAGLAKGSTYYVVNRSDDDFKLSTTEGGTAVNVTSDGKLDLALVADNTAGFILTGYEIDDTGKATTNVVRTNTSWEVTDTKPYWYPAMVLRQLTSEAATRGVYRFSRLTYGFTWTAPTSGAWSTTCDLTLKVGADLLTVMNDLVDLGHDFWLNPTTCQLDAWESRGTDRSATVVLDTGVNLIRFTTVVEPKIKTVAVVRTNDGWLRVANDSLRTANGWREVFLEYGSTTSDDTAAAAARLELARTGKTQVIANAVEVAVATGSVPYVDFDIADIVSIPDPAGTGGLSTARLLSIALKDDGGSVTFSPELEVITSA